MKKIKFFELRLYRNGALIDKVSVGRPFWLTKIKAIPPAENEEQFLGLLEKHFSFSLPKVHDARSLAVEECSFIPLEICSCLSP